MRTTNRNVQIHVAWDLFKDNLRPTTEYGISMENLEVSEVQREREDEQNYACHEGRGECDKLTLSSPSFQTYEFEL